MILKPNKLESHYIRVSNYSLPVCLRQVIPPYLYTPQSLIFLRDALELLPEKKYQF